LSYSNNNQEKTYESIYGQNVASVSIYGIDKPTLVLAGKNDSADPDQRQLPFTYENNVLIIDDLDMPLNKNTFDFVQLVF
jgi:hypothetical protein